MAGISFAQAMTLAQNDQGKLLAMLLSGQQPDGTTITDPDDPGNDAVPVTPSDTVDLTVSARGLIVESSGDVRVITAAGNTRTIPAVLLPDGQMLPLKFTRVLATGTTATGIWALT